ncbi:MAG: hypothetical protein ACMG57_05175 [Candidatus Dojkabacteria bacterium]
MKNIVFVISIVLLFVSTSSYLAITALRNSSKQYWGDNVNLDGSWLSKENTIISEYRVKEGVKGTFNGYGIPKNKDKDLLTLRLTDSVEKTDFTVTIPRLYNADKISMTSEDLIKTLESNGGGVFEIVNPSDTEQGYLNTIFFVAAP